MVSDLPKSLSTVHSLPVELKFHGVGGHVVLLLLQDRNLHTDTHTHTHFQVKALWNKGVRSIRITESSPPRSAKTVREGVSPLAEWPRGRSPHHLGGSMLLAAGVLLFLNNNQGDWVALRTADTRMWGRIWFGLKIQESPRLSVQ